MEPPPILPDIETELKSYLICPERLPIHQYERNQQLWPREPNAMELFDYETSPVCTTLKVQRDVNTGEIMGFREVSLQTAGATAKNSMSLNRDPAPASDATRGSASFMPFWPGSFPDPTENLPVPEMLDSDLLTIPPGFKKGLVFDADGRTILDESRQPSKFTLDSNVVNLLDLMQEDADNFGNTPEKQVQEDGLKSNAPLLPEELEVLPEDAPILHISTMAPPVKLQGTEWAILLDTSKPVKDFKERIPEMACNFDFELDTFQKLAVLQLEQHNHVFVAAHTSAGKTVVAEYAIALSKKHMTRTIYTSPIKALSNQKYCDFKAKFKDVGLITGDVQINPTASCLIMTTEILRTMLYCGSDVTRDLEYVIFDEVHYINDRERGHVWEQVLILLPAHVCVVLLSATVPNTIEFADWLGRTHQRRVFVVTTNKRPVPLRHFLYTGTGGGSRDNRFLILDADQMAMEGYVKAVQSIKKPDTKQGAYKPQYVAFTPKQEKNLWYGLIDHLNRHSLLPVVAFTFSRAKCDKNSEMLTNLDLTTKKEKAKVHMLFEKYLKTLKEPDREIPQILRLKEILHRGIGVHHSGILPIMKEIVEILFQQGHIKLLFATETFAMGVNMPARTVVFDSISKHDGQQRRNLKPAEYIQMAGRAGRRGLDQEGTVIILCKNKVPDLRDLQDMMMGIPNQLKSQFRLTYGMVLSLLRVERLRVEDMMSRSFLEADYYKKTAEIQEKLQKVEEELQEIASQELSSYLQPLVEFYKICREYLTIRDGISNSVFSSPKLAKVMVPGRILLVTHRHHINKLALLLSVIKRKSVSYNVLVLSDSSQDGKDDLYYKMLGLASDCIFAPIASPSHQVLLISPSDIDEITDKSMKIDADLVMKDWEKRQIERFKLDPPGQTCQQAVQELHKLTITISRKTETLSYLHFIQDLKLNDQLIYSDLLEMYELKDKLIDHLPSTQIPNFDEQFYTVFSRKFLEDKRDNLKYLLSNSSLQLYPDYRNRILLLRDLKYVDNDNQVTFKGKVACEVGMNELLITELVLDGILTNLEPEEVAALLSTLVLSPKRQDTDDDLGNLSKDLLNAIEKIKEIHKKIADSEMKLQIKTDEFQNDLNLCLVEVVYEWALAKPFAEIMTLTDIQEGIIVRCIQQLNDTIGDVRNAARIIGNPTLKKKMEEASTAIKRDIVFAASLYTV